MLAIQTVALIVVMGILWLGVFVLGADGCQRWREDRDPLFLFIPIVMLCVAIIATLLITYLIRISTSSC